MQTESLPKPLRGGRIAGVSKTATISAAIDWIAENDETAETDVEVIATLVTVQLVADLWGRDPAYIAQRVLARRKP